MTGPNKRPNPKRKYPTPRKMAVAIKNYFDVTDEERITISGLCLALGLSRQSFHSYATYDGFEELVDIARLRVENAYELSLREKGGAANIFAMKQFGWQDKHEIEHTGSDDKPIVTRVVREVVPMKRVGHYSPSSIPTSPMYIDYDEIEDF